LIFEADQAKKLLRGEKTLTIRSRWKRQLQVGDVAVLPYKPDHAYSIRVAGAEKPKATKLTVVTVRPGSLDTIALVDAHAAGFRTTDELRAWWAEHRHVTTDVWLIAVVLGDRTYKPRLLRAGAPSASVCTKMIRVVVGGKAQNMQCGRGFLEGAETCSRGHRRPAPSPEDSGYTSSTKRALAGVGEEVPADAQDAYSLDRRVEYAKGRAALVDERAELSPAERLALLESESKRLGVDVSGERRLILERLERAERQAS
jgi:hypothetical protein